MPLDPIRIIPANVRRLIATALVAGAFALAPARPAAASPCQLTEEQREAYEADGTLGERLEFAEALDLDQPDPALVARAVERDAGDDSALAARSSNNVPIFWRGGMATEGAARVLALRVSFPAEGDEPALDFEQGDTLEALDALIDGGGGSFPYEDLSSYYRRSSYGRLSISGDAFDYTALHARSHYDDDVLALFAEAMSALDAQIDYSDYDANADGYIDAVYLHFAGGDTGWMSTWWSITQTWGDTGTEFDGVKPSKVVTLHLPSDDPFAAATVIHETGHVLGLPDYYSASTQTGGASWPSGIMGSDMMMDNVGDHNGFSKWLLGWLDEDEVTRVEASSAGIVVSRGGEVVERVSPGDDGASALQLSLASYTDDDPARTGGIIVLSNEDEGMFSDYYVLQYDTFAGNQSLYLPPVSEDAEPQAIPNGFRMYRVMAELTDGGFDFIHNNLYGSVNNQLIELVDPDMDEMHVPGSGDVICGAASGEYGCMLREGDEVTPGTHPSTNFFEAANFGYTGIGVRVDACGDDAGTLTVSHSGLDEPDTPDFALEPVDGQALYNAGTLVFEATVSVRASLAENPTVVIDGRVYPAALRAEGTRVEVETRLDPAVIGPDSVCEVVFPAGQFSIGADGAGEETVSPETQVPVAAGDVARIARSGEYDIERAADAACVVSEPIGLDGGVRAVFALQGDRVTAQLVAEDGTAERSFELGGAYPQVEACTRIEACALGGDRAALVLMGEEGARVLLADLGNGEAADAGSIRSFDAPVPMRAGDGVLLLAGTLAALVEEGPDGPEMTFGVLDATAAAAAGDGTVVWERFDPQAMTSRFMMVSGEDLARALRTAGSGTEDTALGAAPVTDALGAGEVRELEEAGITELVDADAHGGRVALLGRASGAGWEESGARAAVFDAEGALTGSVDVAGAASAPGAGSTFFSRVRLAADGSLAVTGFQAQGSGYAPLETVLFAASSDGAVGGEPAGRVIANAPVQGVWMDDGSWLALSWPMGELPGPAGAPAGDAASGGGDGAEALGYAVTEPIAAADDPGDPDAPVDPDTPVEPEASEDPGSAGDATDADDPSGSAREPGILARTGDGMPAAVLAAGGAGAVCAAAGIALAIRRRHR